MLEVNVKEARSQLISLLDRVERWEELIFLGLFFFRFFRQDPGVLRLLDSGLGFGSCFGGFAG